MKSRKWVRRAFVFFVAFLANLQGTVAGPPPPPSVAFSPDGNILAVLHPTHILLLDTSTWELKQTLKCNEHIRSIAFSPDGKTLATVSRPEVKFWDIRMGALERTLTVQGKTEESVKSVAFSPDMKLVVTGGAYVRVWDTEMWTLKQTLGDTAPSPPVAFSPNGKFLAVGRYNGVDVWDTRNWSLHRKLKHSYSVDAIAFSPDSQTFVSCGSGQGNYAGKVRFWDVQTWNLKRVIPQNGFDSIAYSLSFSPDGKIVASGHRMGTVKIRDAQTWAVRLQFTYEDLASKLSEFSA